MVEPMPGTICQYSVERIDIGGRPDATPTRFGVECAKGWIGNGLPVDLYGAGCAGRLRGVGLSCCRERGGQSVRRHGQEWDRTEGQSRPYCLYCHASSTSRPFEWITSIITLWILAADRRICRGVRAVNVSAVRCSRHTLSAHRDTSKRAAPCGARTVRSGLRDAASVRCRSGRLPCGSRPSAIASDRAARDKRGR